VPPSVVVNTLGNTPGVVQSSFNLVGTPLSIPFSFTGTSNMSTGVITGLTATLDGTTPLVVTWPPNQKIATGTATIIVTTPGLHTISVTATDFVGTTTLSPPVTSTSRNMRSRLCKVLYSSTPITTACKIPASPASVVSP